MRKLAPSGGSARGASTTLSYVLTLSITAILISGLLIATGGVLEDRRESVTRDELQVVGQQISAKLMAADRLAATDPAELVVRGDFPNRIAGSAYTIAVNASGPQPHLRLVATDVDASVTVSLTNRTALAETRIVGGDLEITLTAADELEVQRQ